MSPKIRPKTKMVKIEKDISTPVLRIPVKLLGYYSLYYAPVNEVLDVDDSLRVTGAGIVGVLTIKGREGAMIDVYQYRNEEMIFPPKFFSSRTRWVFRGGRWKAIFTQVFSNIDGITDICYCYSSDTDECNCSFGRDEEE
jgi:hypothetical protein